MKINNNKKIYQCKCFKININKCNNEIKFKLSIIKILNIQFFFTFFYNLGTFFYVFFLTYFLSEETLLLPTTFLELSFSTGVFDSIFLTFFLLSSLII